MERSAAEPVDHDADGSGPDEPLEREVEHVEEESLPKKSKRVKPAKLPISEKQKAALAKARESRAANRAKAEAKKEKPLNIYQDLFTVI